MNAEQIEKAIQLCQDLQAHTLNTLVQSVKGGQRLGAKDLRLIQDIRKQLEAQRTFAKGAEEWLPLNEAGKRLGVNVRTLQLWCSGKDALHQPALPHRKDNRRVMLPLHTAHAHLTQHAKRLALKSIEPAAAAEPKASEVADGDMPADLLERLEVTLSRMSQRLMATPHGLRLYSQTLKAVEETKARREAALRNLTVEDARKMIQSVGELFCQHVEHHAPALAKHMCQELRHRCAVDVCQQNHLAEKIMEVATCEWANSVLDAIRKCVKEQVEEAERKAPLANRTEVMSAPYRADLATSLMPPKPMPTSSLRSDGNVEALIGGARRSDA